MRPAFVIFSLLTTSALWGQWSPLTIDTKGDINVVNCVDVPQFNSIWCNCSSTNPITFAESTFLVKLNATGGFDSMTVHNIAPGTSLYTDSLNAKTYLIGRDSGSDSLLVIGEAVNNNQFDIINSIKLQGKVQFIGPVRRIDDTYFIMGDISYGSVSNDVFMIKLETLTDNKPEVRLFSTYNILTSLPLDMIDYEHDNYLLSIHGYPVPSLSGLNQFLILDSAMNVEQPFYIPQEVYGNINFIKLVGKTFFNARLMVLDTIQIQVTDDLIIGVLDSLLPDSTIQFHYSSFGKDNIDEFEGYRSFVSNNTYLFLGGTSNVDYWDVAHADQDADFILGKYDLNLNQEWVKYMGLPDMYDILGAAITTDDGGCILVGTTYDYNNNPIKERDILIYKLDADGNVVTGVPKAPESGIALQVYPNPTSLTLVIDPEQDQTGTFHLINTVGQKAGTWEINDRTTLSVGHLPTGIYFYHFETRDGEKTSGQVVIAR